MNEWTIIGHKTANGEITTTLKDLKILAEILESRLNAIVLNDETDDLIAQELCQTAMAMGFELDLDYSRPNHFKLIPYELGSGQDPYFD